jgi:hypothetical protein
VSESRQITLEEAARLLPNLQRCPVHPQFVVMPFFGLFPCCLYAALERIRDTDFDAVPIAERAIRSPNPKVKGMPKLIVR